MNLFPSLSVKSKISYKTSFDYMHNAVYSGLNRVRFYVWTVSVFCCGSCPFFRVDRVHFYLWTVSVLSCGSGPLSRVDHVHFCLWIVSAFSCGSCPLLREEIHSASMRGPVSTVLL